MATRKNPLGTSREVEPNSALLEEIHRTVGHVAALGEIVDALPRDQLVEGVTKTVTDAEGGRTVTVETAPNIWLRLYKEERKHLLDACRTASACGVKMAPRGAKDVVDQIAEQRSKRRAGVAKTATLPGS